MMAEVQNKNKQTDFIENEITPESFLRIKGLNSTPIKVLDREKIISVDHGAIRIGYIKKPGWNRHGITVGPFKRENGLTVGIEILNGHNNSQTSVFDIMGKRRLLFGVLQRFLGWLPDFFFPGKLKIWIYPSKPHNYNLPHITESLLVGWFNKEKSVRPLNAKDNNFLVHAANVENGELWANCGGNSCSVIKSLQNNMMVYLVVLRKCGAVYYVASVANSKGAAAFPYMRPVCLEPFSNSKNMYAGVFQSILGEVGFRVDSRIMDLKVEHIPEFGEWFGSAFVADKLSGQGTLRDRNLEKGSRWQIILGDFDAGDTGAIPVQHENIALTYCESLPGLIHVLVNFSAPKQKAGLIWRATNCENYFIFTISLCAYELSIVIANESHLLSSGNINCAVGKFNSIQILDDGKEIGLYVNGKLVSDEFVPDTRFNEGHGVGFHASNGPGEIRIKSFEAHAQQIEIPQNLNLHALWQPNVNEIILTESFNGPICDLSEMKNKGGNLWRKEIGEGRFLLTGGNALKVNASPEKPNPGRTVYTIDWQNPAFADVSVEVTPPGTEKGEGQKGRGGVIFMQDINNYVIVNTYLCDWHIGNSISSFFKINGKEDTYNAVWTNVGNRIHWGVSFVLRVVFDGNRYQVYLNDEAVLYRALSDVFIDFESLQINRVGLVANWEFGNDTGTEFRDFIGRTI